MAVRTPLSPFAIGSAFQLGAMAGFFGIFIAAPSHVELPLILTWMGVAAGGALFMRCPKCGKSLFMKGMFAVPWPASECRRCGTDLTATPPESDRA